MILFLLIVFALAVYIMTPEERTRVVRPVIAGIRRVKDVANLDQREGEPFRDALHARTPRALVTPALVALNATIFVFMLFGAGAVGDPETLVRWGGNFGPRTTNGDWWRLVTTMFVHSGMLHLVASIAGLVQLGLVLERLVGRFAVAAVYVAAGVLTGLVHLWTHPVTVSVGASGAIFGLYGLLLTVAMWGMLHPSAVTIPLKVIRKLCPAAAVFLLYNIATGGVELAGLVAGVICGLVLVKDVGERKPAARRVALAMAAAGVIAVASAVPLRGIADVGSEIDRIVAVEDRTAGAYRTAVDRFRSGRITAEALAELIRHTIVPELQVARTRLKALDRVPHEHQPLIAAADEYLRLRDESWRLRAEALHKSSMLTLREADETEQASLEALRRIRSADGK